MSSRHIIHTIFFVFTIIGLSLIVFPVAAQLAPLDCSGTAGIPCNTQEDVSTVHARITTLVNIALGLIGIVAAIYLILGGVKYIMSQGDDSATKEAKHTILYAIIGLVVIGLAAMIVNFVVEAIIS